MLGVCTDLRLRGQECLLPLTSLFWGDASWHRIQKATGLHVSGHRSAGKGQFSHSFAKEWPAAPCLDSPPLCFQAVLDGAISSLQLSNLTSHTEYLVSVVPVYDTVVGDALRGITSTCRS